MKKLQKLRLLERICWKSQTRKWIISLPKFGEGFVLLGKNVNGKLKFLAPLLVTKFDVFEQEIPRQHHSRIAHPPTNLIMPIDNQWQFIKEARRQGRCGTTEGMVHWVMKRNGRKLKGQGRASSFSRLLYNEEKCAFSVNNGLYIGFSDNSSPLRSLRHIYQRIPTWQRVFSIPEVVV